MKGGMKRREKERVGGREITHPFIANALDNPSLIHVRAMASWAHSLLMALCLNTAALKAALNTCAQGDTPDTQELCFLPSRGFHRGLQHLSQSPPRVTRTRRAEVCDALSLEGGNSQATGGWLKSHGPCEARERQRRSTVLLLWLCRNQVWDNLSARPSVCLFCLWGSCAHPHKC